MVGENGFRLVAETQEKVNVPGRAQHGAGIELMDIGRDPFDFPDQRFPGTPPIACCWAGRTNPLACCADSRTQQTHDRFLTGSMWGHTSTVLERIITQANPTETFRLLPESPVGSGQLKYEMLQGAWATLPPDTFLLGILPPRLSQPSPGAQGRLDFVREGQPGRSLCRGTRA